MPIRWRQILKVALPMLMAAIAFSAYAYSLPDMTCVIVNEGEQTTIKAQGNRCVDLQPGEESVVLTQEGVEINQETAQ